MLLVSSVFRTTAASSFEVQCGARFIVDFSQRFKRRRPFRVIAGRVVRWLWRVAVAAATWPIVFAFRWSENVAIGTLRRQVRDYRDEQDRHLALIERLQDDLAFQAMIIQRERERVQFEVAKFSRGVADLTEEADV